MVKPPALIILKALLSGIPVDGIQNEVLCCSEEGQFGYKISEDQMYVVDWSLNWFLKFCRELPPEKVMAVAAQIALNEKEKTR